MITATFQVGWMTVNAKGETPSDLIREVEKVQDLQCLCHQAAMMGTKKDQKEIRKLLDFLEKYSEGKLTLDDVRGLDICLSIGDIKCEELTEECMHG